MFFQPQPGANAGSLRQPGQCRAHGWCGCVILLLVLAVNTGRAGPVELSPQVITLPANTSEPHFIDHFVDISGDGRFDLLVIDPGEKKLLNYHQRPDGFGNSPDQVIPLPPQTAWVAVGDVDPHPGLELLMSTATGLVYFRQNAGRFESEQHTLIAINQVFTNDDLPTLISLATNQGETNLSIPVISPGQTVLYHRNSAYEWSPGPPIALNVKQTDWSVSREEWTAGSNPAHSFFVQQSFRAKREPEQDQEPDNEAIQKLVADLKKNTDAFPPLIKRVDVDGDGREDLVLWQTSGKLNFKTDIYIFLRGVDQKLPDRPTQILHCRGLPFPTSSAYMPSPIVDLNGDGHYELALLELNSSIASANGLVNMLLSHGLDGSLTIRPFQNGAFSRSPVGSVPVTVLLASEVLKSWPIFIQGDFNGDGRPDLLVRRSDGRWNIFFSTTDGHWFAPQPALTFAVPSHGYIAIKDLNGDGRSDIIWYEPDAHRASIFMSPASLAKGKNP